MSDAPAEVEETAEGAIEEVTKLPSTLRRNAIIGLLLAGIAAFTLFLRYQIMHNANSVAKHAHLYADLINAAWDLLMLTSILIIDVVEEIWSIVRGIIRLFEDKKADIGNKFSNFNRENLRKYLNPVQASELADTAGNLPARCADYVGAGPVLQGMVRPFADPVVCPLVRWTYPSKPLWRVTNGALGWMTYGATPPGQLGSCLDCTAPNCNTNSTGLTDTLCVGLGVGYVVAEVLIPLFVLQMVFPVLWKVIKGALKLFFEVVSQTTKVQ